MSKLFLYYFIDNMNGSFGFETAAEDIPENHKPVKRSMYWFFLDENKNI